MSFGRATSGNPSVSVQAELGRDMPQKMPVVSLFCGCGGLDLGFESEGFESVVAIDNNPIAVETYNMNHPGMKALCGDLSTLKGSDVVRLVENIAPGVRPRGVIGGPPCQSFSRGNVHSVDADPRHELPLHYAQILEVLNKEYHLDFFVFENVVGLKSNKHQERFTNILKALENAGFTVFEDVLNAKWFGVPQSRRRVFVVGINRELYPNVDFRFPPGDLRSCRTVENAIGGLPEPAYFRRGLSSSNIPFHPNHWTMNPRSSKLTGMSTSDTKNGRSFRRLDWQEPSPTVAYGHREIHVHPDGKRRLSIFEAMRLQGFPDDYVLLGNLTSQVTQVSDAVPPPLARAIAQAIRSAVLAPQEEVSAQLLVWFDHHERHFPWRDTTDPYAILLAEKLLQQTSVGEPVLKTYSAILSRFPTVYALAQATQSELESMMAVLGFRYRAAELPRIAQEIVRRHGGFVPDDLKELLRLPGVGEYIAGAVLCFAFVRQMPIVDTNVARFLYRLFGLSGSLPSNPARNHRLWVLASNLVPIGAARSYNLAVLDLCAEVCTPSNPKCTACPAVARCQHGQMRMKGV